MINSYKKILPSVLVLLSGLPGLWLMPDVALAAYQCEPLETVASETPDIRHEQGLLWRISKDGVSSSYLYGTIHVSDPAITNLPQPVSQALQESQHFVMEAKLDSMSMLSFSQQMFYSDGRKLSDLLNADQYDRAKDLLAAYSIPPLAAQSLKPWAAFMTLNMPPDNGMPLDLVLMGRAEKQGLSIDGLESMAEQVDVFQQLNETTQVQLLVDTICHYEVLQKDMEQMKALYQQRDLQGLFRYHNKYNLQGREVYQQLMQRLLWDRNRVMADRMQPMLARGDAFIAIGAMHLPGEQGVLTHLEKAGFQVRAVY